MYIIIAIGTIALIGYVYFLGGENAVANYKEKLAVAEKKVEDADKKIEAEAANHISDMESAYKAGEADAKTVEKTVYVRVASDLTKYPVFQNPACTLPDQSYALLVAALRGTRTGVVLPLQSPSPAPAGPISAPAVPSNGSTSSQLPVQATPLPAKPVPRHKAGAQ
jgi:hypothetical protein